MTLLAWTCEFCFWSSLHTMPSSLGLIWRSHGLQGLWKSSITSSALPVQHNQIVRDPSPLKSTLDPHLAHYISGSQFQSESLERLHSRRMFKFLKFKRLISTLESGVQNLYLSAGTSGRSTPMSQQPWIASCKVSHFLRTVIDVDIGSHQKLSDMQATKPSACDTG